MVKVDCTNNPLNSVLFICEKHTKYEGITRLFDSNDFAVDVRFSNLQDVDVPKYGAIIHVTNSSKSLPALLGDRLASIKDEEWILIANDDEDLHCTAELTVLASKELKLFIRTLWATFNVT